MLDPSYRDAPYSTVAVSRSGDRFAWLTMNRPEKRNAMSREMERELYEALDELADDPDVDVVLLTGAGDAFCAGMDLEDMRSRQRGDRPFSAAEERYTTWKSDRLWRYPKVTVAVVNGWCVGGGFTQAISCDLAVAAEEARFSVSEVNFGGIPGGTVAKLLTEAMGYRDALYWSLTAEVFDGRKAAELGVVNFAVPLASLRQTAEDLARRLLEKNQSALRHTKQAIRTVREMGLQQSAEYLGAKSAQSRLLDPSRGRERGYAGFLDDKTFRPGVEAAPGRRSEPADGGRDG